MVPAKGRRLDFMVLNHDEDLISVTVRTQLVAMQGMQRKSEAWKETASFALTTVEKAGGAEAPRKPDLLPARNLSATAPVK